MKNYTCGDCGKKPGELHMDGCDIERCPKCHGQLLSCDCKFPQIAVDRSFLLDETGKKFNRSKVGNSIDEDFNM